MPGAECLGDLPGDFERRDLAGFHAFDANALFDGFGGLRQHQRFLQQAERIAGLERAIDEAAQAIAHLGRRQHGIGQLAAEPIARRRIRAAARKDQRAHGPAEEPVGEVAQEIVQLLLRLVELVAAGPFDDRQIVRGTPLVLVVLEHHRGEVHGREHVAQARGEILLLLQVAAEREHGDVDGERERRRETHDVLVIALGVAHFGHVREARVRERHDERAHRVADGEADVAEQRAIEFVDALLAVRVARGVHLLAARTDGSASRPGRR